MDTNIIRWFIQVSKLNSYNNTVLTWFTELNQIQEALTQHAQMTEAEWQRFARSAVYIRRLSSCLPSLIALSSFLAIHDLTCSLQLKQLICTKKLTNYPFQTSVIMCVILWLSFNFVQKTLKWWLVTSLLLLCLVQCLSG